MGVGVNVFLVNGNGDYCMVVTGDVGIKKILADFTVNENQK